MTKEQARDILLKLIGDVPMKRSDYIVFEKAIEVLYQVPKGVEIKKSGEAVK